MVHRGLVAISPSCRHNSLKFVPGWNEERAQIYYLVKLYRFSTLSEALDIHYRFSTLRP